MKTNSETDQTNLSRSGGTTWMHHPQKHYQMKTTLQKLMKTTFTFMLALALTAGIFVHTANAQVTVTGSTGANVSYARLALALTAINGTAQTGNNIVIINSNF
jgi:hypothetical protein